MKKKLLAIILAVVMMFSSATPAFAADISAESFFTKVAVKVIDALMTGLTGMLNSVVKDGETFVDAKDFALTDFYEGTQEILSGPAENSRWSLGYDSRSLVPENISDYKLFLGGFMAIENAMVNNVKGKTDDMMVRTVALSDGSERGISIFATIDCIGMTNTDIRAIRALLADFAKEKNINSINIFSTHAHSCIDTQGLWTENFKKIPMNLVNGITGKGTSYQGTDPKYMAFLFEKVRKSVEAAVAEMKTGEMTFAQKDIGEKYFDNRNRESASALMTDLSRFTFTPDDGSTPTIIANMAAHPDTAGLPVESDKDSGHYISGDYVYYIGETLNKAGYNFLYIGGAICGIYIGRDPSDEKIESQKRVEISQRYGRKLGKILLSLTLTEDEIRNDAFLSELTDREEQLTSDKYVYWYEGWEPVEETTVEPLLNVKIKSVRINVTNNIMILAAKLNLANHTVIKEDGKYFISTEIGLVNLGSKTAVMMPGEICQDLVCGGASLTAEGSVSGKAFSGKTVDEIFGDDLIIFGLANDAIGYVVPDNDYAIGLDFGHYHETLSLGKKTASTLISEYESLK